MHTLYLYRLALERYAKTGNSSCLKEEGRGGRKTYFSLYTLWHVFTFSLTA